MPRQGQIRKQAPEEDKKGRPEGQFVPDQRSFGMPNSLMRAGMMTSPLGTPNSVMREMGPEDSGVLFGSRGFDRSAGAHELSHTVRRESVPSPVTRSVPSNTIQRDPPDEDEEEETVEEQLNATLHSAPMLLSIFEGDQRRIRIRINELRDQIAGVQDHPDVVGEMSDFVDRLENAVPNLREIIDHLTAARKALQRNKDDAAAKSVVRAETRRYREYVQVHNRYIGLERTPDMAAHLVEVEDMAGEFAPWEEDQLSEDDFEVVGRGAQPAAADAPPSYGTPGGDFDGPSAPAPASPSYGTPGGDYDGPPPSFSPSAPPAPEEEDEKDKSKGSGGFFSFFRKKKK